MASPPLVANASDPPSHTARDEALPTVNASLNATCGACLLTGYVFMRRRRIQLHRRFMLAACFASLVFLALYVLNHVLRHGIVTHFISGT